MSGYTYPLILVVVVVAVVCRQLCRVPFMEPLLLLLQSALERAHCAQHA